MISAKFNSASFCIIVTSPVIHVTFRPIASKLEFITLKYEPTVERKHKSLYTLILTFVVDR